MKVFNYVLAGLCLAMAVITFVTKADVAWFTGGLLWLIASMYNFTSGLEASLK